MLHIHLDWFRLERCSNVEKFELNQPEYLDQINDWPKRKNFSIIKRRKFERFVFFNWQHNPLALHYLSFLMHTIALIDRVITENNHRQFAIDASFSISNIKRLFNTILKFPSRREREEEETFVLFSIGQWISPMK